ncbi:hypothetical protein [Sphingomonas sp. Leaf357]|uniref:hypothetical protein n=1 Tax=Sphingomonas sp. Leaf357 TaxID=1736350 RepID=UPI000ACE43E7|nr:hypothetical protein [Sphingomonas sp. Leaf357]
MRKAITGLLLGCAMLAGCGDPPPRGGGTTNAAEAGPDPMEAKIAALLPTLQRTTFFRAINDADYDCQSIVNVVSRGKIDGKPSWAVECNRGAQYIIELQRGGVFHVSGVPKNYR